MEHLTLSDLSLLIKRKRQMFTRITGAMLAASLLLCLMWSNYKATAEIAIEQARIAPSVTALGAADAVSSTLLADRRIREVEQKVTSTESLSAIIKSLNLYGATSTSKPIDELAEAMRKHIRLEFTSNQIANPLASQKESIDQLSANGFTLQFAYSDAVIAKQTLDALVQRFIEEDARLRQSKAAETVNFINTELDALAAAIHEQEQEVATFRTKHGETGQVARQMREQASISNRLNQQNVESSISANQATIGTLRGQLAATDPYMPLLDKGEVLHAPTSQLKTLKSQLATISGRYGPDHPDVVKLRSQIAALQKSKPRDTGTSNDADNPVYLQLTAQLNAALAQQKTLLAQRESLKELQTEYTTETEQDPQLEQELSKLTLDLDNSKERYRMLKDKKLAAEMKQRLEASTSGAQLRLVAPIALPTHNSPPRILLAILGICFSLLTGLVSILLSEWLRPTIRSTAQVKDITGLVPLISIPTLTK